MFPVATVFREVSASPHPPGREEAWTPVPGEQPSQCPRVLRPLQLPGSALSAGWTGWVLSSEAAPKSESVMLLGPFQILVQHYHRNVVSPRLRQEKLLIRELCFLIRDSLCPRVKVEKKCQLLE